MVTRASLDALGRPAIPTPRDQQLVSLQQSINNARERIERVEAHAVATRALLGSNKTGDTLDFLQLQVNQIKTGIDALAAQLQEIQDTPVLPTTVWVDRSDGEDGPMGTRGLQGEIGPRGYAIAFDGDDGEAGMRGPAGPPGANGVTSMMAWDSGDSDSPFSPFNPLASNIIGLFADPSASIGLTTVPGSALTAMRSDAAPALSQSISPTMTGNWTFAPASGNTLVSAGNFGVGGAPAVKLHVIGAAGVTYRVEENTSGNNTRLEMAANTSNVQLGSKSNSQINITVNDAPVITITTSKHLQMLFDNQEVQIGAGQDFRLFHDGTDSWLRNDTGLMKLSAGATVQAQYDTSYFEMTTAVRKSATTSPAQITSNQNDYAGLATTTANLRINSDTARDVTGLTGGAAGREVLVTNVGAFAITLKNQNASSTAANRFGFGADVILGVDVSVLIRYDSTSSRWRAA